MDKIIMRGLSFSGRHGLLPGEKDKPQPFIIDLVLYLDLRTAGQRDDIKYTIDYGEVFRKVQRLVEESSYNLIETLAEEISRDLLERYRRLAALQVTVYKPEAPIKGKFDRVAVQVYRLREEGIPLGEAEDD